MTSDEFFHAVMKRISTWVPDIEIKGLQDNRARCADKTSHSRWSAGGMKKNPGGPTTGTPEYRWRFFSREVPAMYVTIDIENKSIIESINIPSSLI